MHDAFICSQWHRNGVAGVADLARRGGTAVIVAAAADMGERERAAVLVAVVAVAAAGAVFPVTPQLAGVGRTVGAPPVRHLRAPGGRIGRHTRIVKGFAEPGLLRHSSMPYELLYGYQRDLQCIYR